MAEHPHILTYVLTGIVMAPSSVHRRRRMSLVNPEPPPYRAMPIGQRRSCSNLPAAIIDGSPDVKQDQFTANRVEHIKCHFLNRLFRQLNANRRVPLVNPPYPTPIGYPSKSSALILDLAFQGFHPALFADKATPAFAVAMRFWLWRLHTSLQLGSGQS